MKPCDPTKVSATARETRQTAFLAAYAQTLSVTDAAHAAGTARDTHYAWLRDDPTYPARFEAARVQAIDAAAGVAYQRATVGGSDTLLMFMLRGHSDRYRDKADVRHSGPGGGPIVVGQITDPLRDKANAVMEDPKAMEALLTLGAVLAKAELTTHAPPQVDGTDPVG